MGLYKETNAFTPEANTFALYFAYCTHNTYTHTHNKYTCTYMYVHVYMYTDEC